MIEAVEFKNFKVLRDATLPLGPLTLLVGPNGSGKSTAISGLRAVADRIVRGVLFDYSRTVSIGSAEEGNRPVSIKVSSERSTGGRFRVGRTKTGDEDTVMPDDLPAATRYLSALRYYALDPLQLAAPVHLQPTIEMTGNGYGLAGVLDRLRDQHPERFEALNRELARWLPEFDRILFETPESGKRAFALRSNLGRQPIPASELSEGTLLAVALLTLAHLADPPSILAIEEPDRGIHPRLLRDVQDALYRLAFPRNYGENRPAVQVIATTHSPYFLDLFRDHPEQVVIAQKNGLEATFERLSDRPDIAEILGDAPLGEVWYSGILGGVPAGT